MAENSVNVYQDPDRSIPQVFDDAIKYVSEIIHDQNTVGVYVLVASKDGGGWSAVVCHDDCDERIVDFMNGVKTIVSLNLGATL